MGLEGDGDIPVDREEIINEDNIVLTRRYQEPAIPREIYTRDPSAVPALVLLQQNQRLEGSVHSTTLIDCKSLVLANRQQSSVGTEGSAFNWAFEVELPHHEIAVQIEERRMSSEIYRDEKGVIGR